MNTLTQNTDSSLSSALARLNTGSTLNGQYLSKQNDQIDNRRMIMSNGMNQMPNYTNGNYNQRISALSSSSASSIQHQSDSTIRDNSEM